MMKWHLEGFELDISGLEFLEEARGSDEFSEGFAKDIFGQARRRWNEDAGFYDWPVHGATNAANQATELASELRREFDSFLFIGIGGSHLGPQSVIRACGDGDRPYYWLSNVDPASIRGAERFLKDHRPATVVISKSGGTLETIAGFSHLSRQLDPKGWVFVTDPDEGVLRRLATEHSIRTLSVPKNIGGRYSVLTPVGLLPIALLGCDADQLIAGAQQMRAQLEQTSSEKNPAYQLAASLYLCDQAHGHSIQYLMPYASELELFAAWWVQLWGESLGKRINTTLRVGPTPVTCLGTRDQHSLLQLFQDGPRDKVVGFVDVAPGKERVLLVEPSVQLKEFSYLWKHSFDEITQLASHSTRQSLREDGVPTYHVNLTTVNERTLGALFFFFETACALAGELYGVYAYDQPGVERSKVLWKQAMSQQR